MHNVASVEDVSEFIESSFPRPANMSSSRHLTLWAKPEEPFNEDQLEQIREIAQLYRLNVEQRQNGAGVSLRFHRTN